MDSVGEGEGGKIWENGIETCKISCMKRDASPGSMHDTGCLGLVHWDDPEGWYGEGGGRRVQDGEHVYTCGLLKLGFKLAFGVFISFEFEFSFLLLVSMKLFLFEVSIMLLFIFSKLFVLSNIFLLKAEPFIK